MALCADCKSHIRSSVVIDVAPKLPRHPGFGGKFTNPSYSFSRSPPRSDRVNASKVSISVVSHSINVCRSRFDTAASMPGSNNSVSTIWMVSGWLRESGTFQVSRFAVQRFADIYTLDLDVYRRNLDAAASTAGPMDPTGTFRDVCEWLRHVGAYLVSCLAALRYFDIDMLDLSLYRCDLDLITLPLPSNESNDSVGPFWIISGWLRYAGTFLVSRFVFLRWIDLYRSEFDAAASTPGSNDPMEMFRGISAWLRGVGAYPVGRFDFLRLFDVYRCSFQSSASPSMPNGSERTSCMLDG